MEQGQTCTHGNLNWCTKGCFEPDHEDDYLVTLEITIKAKNRDDAFARVEKLLPYPLQVCLYDAEVVEQCLQQTAGGPPEIVAGFVNKMLEENNGGG